MVKVLVIGAAGYIGLRVSQQLRQANHIVYGTTRSSANESTLLLNEVIPIVGPVEPESSDSHSILRPSATLPWLETVKSENIDVVIDLSASKNGVKTILEPLIRLSKDRQANRQPRIGYIYGSGMWLHGSGDNVSSDLVPVGAKTSLHQPPALVAWRPELEREVLGSYEHLYAAIIRPSLVYGGDGKIWDLYFEPIYKAIQNNTPITLPADPEAGISLVHVDDTASAFVAAVERLESISGHKSSYPVFDVTTSHESLAYILTKFAKELGYKGPQIQLTGVPEGKGFPEIFIQAFNTKVSSGSTRAKTVLGWKPTKAGFAVGLNVYARSWLAGFKQRSSA
ncbi:hypothetical protein EC957_007290 [Mortierella hygrophila]|uniref:NAD-dependent epimerase/dehydratase domain-containing protein n=1 Tax=Mortierella hygrophila TaxID=979708 RepID=A0A9P6JYN1_9FUNG|nr:hypothetical protein EC957_007290 [Mortierella hygrophila]